MDNQPPLYLQPVASRQLAVFMVGTHGLAAVVVLLMPAMTLGWKIPLWLLVAFSLRYFWRLHIARTAPQAIQEVRFYQVDNCLVRTAKAGVFARLDGSSFLHPWLCVLNLRTRAGRVYTLVLLPDSVPSDVLRQLRVRVKFSGVDAPPNKNPPAREGSRH